jgi:hypothetical protein
MIEKENHYEFQKFLLYNFNIPPRNFLKKLIRNILHLYSKRGRAEYLGRVSSIPPSYT